MGAGSGTHVQPEVDPAVEAALDGERPGNLPEEPEETVPDQSDRAEHPGRRVVRGEGGRGRRAGQPAAPQAAVAVAPQVPRGPFPKWPHIDYGSFPGTYTGIGTTIPSSEAMVVWGGIVEELVGIGSDPAYVAIEVGRTARGPQAMERVNCGMDIDGAIVTGGDNLSPGMALQEYIINVFHAGCPHLTKYDLRVYWKRNQQTIRKNLYLTLEPYDQIQQRRQRSEVYLRSVQRGQPAPPPEPQMMPPVGMGAQGGLRYAVPPPPQQQPWGAPYGYPPPQQLPPPPAPSGPDPAIEALRRDLSAVLARASGQDSVKSELQALVARLQPAPPPVAAAGGLTKEDVARTVVEVLKAMGVGSTPAAPAAVQTAVSTGTVRDPLDAVLEDLERGKKREERVRKLFGIEDEEPQAPTVAAAVVEPEKPPFGVVTVPLATFGGKPVQWPTDVEGGTVEFVKAFIACNPDIGIEGFKIVANLLDKGVIGQAIAMMQRGTPQQQAVAQQAAREGLNGASAHPPSPVVPTPPEEPWSPTP